MKNFLVLVKNWQFPLKKSFNRFFKDFSLSLHAHSSEIKLLRAETVYDDNFEARRKIINWFKSLRMEDEENEEFCSIVLWWGKVTITKWGRFFSNFKTRNLIYKSKKKKFGGRKNWFAKSDKQIFLFVVSHFYMGLLCVRFINREVFCEWELWTKHDPCKKKNFILFLCNWRLVTSSLSLLLSFCSFFIRKQL